MISHLRANTLSARFQYSKANAPSTTKDFNVLEVNTLPSEVFFGCLSALTPIILSGEEGDGGVRHRRHVVQVSVHSDHVATQTGKASHLVLEPANQRTEWEENVITSISLKLIKERKFHSDGITLRYTSWFEEMIWLSITSVRCGKWLYKNTERLGTCINLK